MTLTPLSGAPIAGAPMTGTPVASADPAPPRLARVGHIAFLASDTPLAQDSRARLVARYGDFILMKPPLQSDTWLLWLAPFLVLGVAGSVAWVAVKKAAAREA